MSLHLSEEEQIESFKRWWKDNGIPFLGAVALAVGGWYGWQFWQDHSEAQAQEASIKFNELMEAAATDVLSDSDKSKISELTAALKGGHSGSQYARYAALLQAKLAVERGELDQAADELNWVLDSGADEGLAHVARLRLARVEAARGNADKALNLLESDDNSAFKVAYAEARGDIHMQQGNEQGARAAYQAALDALAPEDGRIRPLLELKLSQVLPTGEGA